MPGPLQMHGRATIRPASITFAQAQVLRYLPTPMTFAAIAGKLGISRGAARERAERLYQKLGGRGRADAVLRARHLSLIDWRKCSSEKVSRPKRSPDVARRERAKTGPLLRITNGRVLDDGPKGSPASLNWKRRHCLQSLLMVRSPQPPAACSSLSDRRQ